MACFGGGQLRLGEGGQIPLGGGMQIGRGCIFEVVSLCGARFTIIYYYYFLMEMDTQADRGCHAPEPVP